VVIPHFISQRCSVPRNIQFTSATATEKLHRKSKNWSRWPLSSSHQIPQLFRVAVDSGAIVYKYKYAISVFMYTS